MRQVGSVDTSWVDYLRHDYDPPHGDTDAGRWQVHFAVEPAERETIRRAATAVMPVEHIDIHADDDDGLGDATIAIRVYATTRDEAREHAGYLFRKIRSAAGLPTLEVRVLGHISPSWRAGSKASDIGKEAHELHRQGRHELAIIRIQTACEMHIERALPALLADTNDPTIDHPPRQRVARPPALVDREEDPRRIMVGGLCRSPQAPPRDRAPRRRRDAR